jgi:hypothetical protein
MLQLLSRPRDSLLTVVVDGGSRLLVEQKLLLNSTTHDLRAVDSWLSAAALVPILRELYSRSLHRELRGELASLPIVLGF